MAKYELKTKKNAGSVSGYINSITDDALRKDGKALLKIFKEATGKQPKMWGESIIGFGEYHYKYPSGQEGDWMATGFSLRKSGPTIYIMPGYSDYGVLLKKLGSYKLGKSCLYLKRLSDIDTDVLKKMIKAGLKDLQKKYTVI
jgi:hypothetical protein